MTEQPAMTVQQKKFTGNSSVLKLYREMVAEDSSLPAWLYYELNLFLFGGLPGLPGFALRSLLYPCLFKNCSKRPAIGKGAVLRNLKKVSAGKKFLMDDYSVLDARGKDAEISIGDHVSLGRNSALVAKDGIISLADGVNIGSNCRLATQSAITVEESVLIAAYAYIGPGNHQWEDSDKPLISQEMENLGGVTIREHAWIGARATVLDGVTVGRKAIVGAHSLVKEDVPDGAIVVGTPAKIVGQR